MNATVSVPRINDNGIYRPGSYSGARGQAFTAPPDVAPNTADKLTGKILGRRVAEAGVRWAKSA